VLATSISSFQYFPADWLLPPKVYTSSNDEKSASFLEKALEKGIVWALWKIQRLTVLHLR